MKETEQYTYEKFKEDFDDAQTPEAKQEVIFALLDSDIDVNEYKEDIQEYRAQLRDLKNQMEAEEDASIDIGIENGTFNLYKCIEDVDRYKAGRNYYVSIDSIKTRYTEKLAGGEVFVKDLDTKIQDYIDGLKDLIWIVTDEGIGTLKRKNLVTSFDFSKHFTKFA